MTYQASARKPLFLYSRGIMGLQEKFASLRVIFQNLFGSKNDIYIARSL